MDTLEASTIQKSEQIWEKYVDWCAIQTDQVAAISEALSHCNRTGNFSAFDALDDAGKLRVSLLASLALSTLHIRVAYKMDDLAALEKTET